VLNIHDQRKIAAESASLLSQRIHPFAPEFFVLVFLQSGNFLGNVIVKDSSLYDE